MDAIDETTTWPFDTEPEKNFLIEKIFTSKIFGYLDYESLRKAENVCVKWKKAIANGKLWEKLYGRNVLQLPDWGKMEQVLRLRNSALFPFPLKDGIEYHKEVCCLIGDTIKKLETNWSNGIHSGTNYSINTTTPSKKKAMKPVDFSMNQRWIARALPDGRISTRNRWSPEEEHFANLSPNNNIPINDADQHPVIEAIQFNDEVFVAVGVVETRKIVFIFEVKEQVESPMLRCSAWKVIENTEATDNLYIFESKFCICLKGELLLLCGKKIEDLSTVVSLMNVRTKASIYRNYEVPSRIGQLTDFALDDWRVVLFFGRKETPRSSKLDRYLLQIRDSATFLLLRSFVLPIIHSEICHFDYSSGFVVTGSDDSPIRIWNATEGTCDGSFQHGCQNLSSLKIVADRLILTCDGQGIVKLWNMYAALNPETRDDPSKVFLRTLDAPIPPYWTFRQVKSLAMQADEFQIVLVLQYDTKSPQLYVMDFFSGGETDEEECQRKTRQNRKRRQV